MPYRPLIGITTYYVERSEINAHNRVRGLPGEDWTMSPLDYSRSVEAAGGIPVLLPISQEEQIPSLLDKLDGLLLAGGEDVDPLRYNEAPEKGLGMVNPWRDSFEWELATAAVAMELPIFGICRGLQLLNAVKGGSLFQDLHTHAASFAEGVLEHTLLQYPKGRTSHEVILEPHSLIRNLYGRERIWVNSYHHQGIKAVGRKLKPSARSSDGLIEALEGDGNGFCLAVQWHPETFTETTDEHIVLFRALVDAASQYRSEKG